jgi:hypothetical protein
MGWGNLEWIELAQDADNCWAFVRQYQTLGFHKMQGIS